MRITVNHWRKRPQESEAQSSLIMPSRKSKSSKLAAGHNGVGPSRDSSGELAKHQEAPINRVLPREIILKIFSYLDLISLCRCASVCKYWNGLAHDGSIWMDVDLFAFQRDVQSVVVENIARRCGPFLRRLNLRGCQHLGDEAVKSFAFFCKNIEVLILQECRKFTNESCRAIGRQCAKLRRLNMDSCSLVGDDGLKALADGCHHLTDVDISWCNDVTDEGVKALLTSNKHIRSFIAKGCTNLSDESIRCLADHCPELTILNIKNCNAVTDVSIQLIGKQCPKLEFLSLSNCTQITNDSLIALAHGCPKLATLELAGCAQLTDPGFQVLCPACPDLHFMDLEECVHVTSNTLISIANYCPKMERLCLSHCELIDDQGIQYLVKSVACRSGRLKLLDLDNCPLLTDRSLEAFRDCQSLERLDLFDCQQLSRNAVRRLEAQLPRCKVHAYFAPGTPPQPARRSRPRFCRCCSIL